MSIPAELFRAILQQKLGILGQALANRILGKGSSGEGPQHISASQSTTATALADSRRASNARQGLTELVYQVQDGYAWQDIQHGYDIARGQSVTLELDSLKRRYPTRRVRVVRKDTRALVDMP
jgi:hypothetical protein